MTRALSDVRLDDIATCRKVVFFEGLPDAYTDDTSGGLLGSGLGSWIGLSETAIGGSEVFGTRRVRPGLVLPDSVSFEIDVATGALQPSGTTFQILDLPGNNLSTLFASEGKTFDILDERIAPGTTALGVSVARVGGTVNPRGRHIGIERIGASGQRRSCPAIPYSLVGFDHAVAPHLPPTWISQSPLVFAGRMATLYRIYKIRPDLDDSDPTAWATWDQAHAAGDLIWWGVMRDAGNIAGNRLWSVDCHGPDGLTRKTLGTRNTSRWMKISADLTVEPESTYVGIEFFSHSLTTQFFYQASIFDHQITQSSRALLAAQINSWIEAAMSGADVNARLTFDPFEDWGGLATGDMQADAGIEPDGTVFVRRIALTEVATLQYGVFCLTLHERVWRILGWEPDRQHEDGNVHEDLTRCRFQKLTAGDLLGGEVIPGDGYWRGFFTTIAPGHAPEEQEYYANSGGGPRIYEPMHTSSVFVLNPEGGQVIRLTGESSETLYLEGQPSAGVESSLNEVDEDPVELGRWGVLRGEYITVKDDPNTEEKIEVSETIKIHLPCKLEWIEGTRHGDVGRGATDLYPSLLIAYYEDPRAWGWNNRRLNSAWAGKVQGKGEIELAPMHAYHCRRYTKPYENACDVWFQVMVSTGSSTGYSAPHDETPTLDAGDNAPTDPLNWGTDIELADMGLCIPHQLVGTTADVIAAFETVPNGYNGNLNKVRLGYIGPYQASDVLDSLMRPRRLFWSLHGKRLGVFSLGPVSPEDVDVDITEDDLYGPVGEPTSVIPSQSLRATGQLDRVDLEFRWDADDGRPVLAQKFHALDAGAVHRTGELVEEVKDHGLCPPWFGDKQEQTTGVGDWTQDFRELWSYQAAEFMAKRHFSVELTVSRPKGQDLMPGTACAITNPWLVNPAGGYGVTGRTGRIIRATHNLEDDSTTVQAIVFAGERQLHYGPAVRIAAVSDTGFVTWYDYQGTDVDGRGLGLPDWLDPDDPTNPEGHIYQRDGETWTRVHTGEISNVDLVNRTCAIAGLPSSSVLRDKDKWLVIGGTETGAPGWADEILATQVDDNLFAQDDAFVD